MACEIAEQNQRLLELNKRLEERATDASAGLSVPQELLDGIDVGIIIVDPNGLIVGGNRRAWEILQSPEREFIGMPAREALPSSLYQALSALGASDNTRMAGRLDVEGRPLQWRACSIVDGEQYRGEALTVWEEVT